MRRLAPFIPVLAFALSACGDGLPTDAGSTGRGPSALISDGAHPVDLDGDGAADHNPDFFFLPPLVGNPAGNPTFKDKAFNPNAAPVVRIVHMATSGPIEVARYTMTSGPGGEVVRLDASGEQYQVNWRTDLFDLVDGGRYRVYVDMSRRPALGFAEIIVYPTAKAAKPASSPETFSLVDGRTLPIKFRIEAGAGCAVAACSEHLVPPSGGTFVIEGTEDAGTAGAFFPDAWAPAGYEGTTFTLRIRRIPVGPDNRCTFYPALIVQYEGCYEYTLEPEIPDGVLFSKDVIVGVCFEIDPANPNYEHVELHRAETRESPPQRLDGRLVDFLDCENFQGTPIQVGAAPHPVMELAARGARRVLDGLDRVFGVRTAYAVDLGIGGPVRELSVIFPAVEVAVEELTGGGQTGTVGDALSGAFSFRLEPLHVHDHEGHSGPEGVVDVPFTFTVAGGTGAKLTPSPNPGGVVGAPSVPVKTNAGGVAAVSLVLGNAAGTYTVTASSPMLHESFTWSWTATATPRGLISGRVTNIGGAGIAGAQVLADVTHVDAEGGSVQRVTTTAGELGGYALEIPSIASARGIAFLVSADGYSAVSATRPLAGEGVSESFVLPPLIAGRWSGGSTPPAPNPAVSLTLDLIGDGPTFSGRSSLTVDGVASQLSIDGITRIDGTLTFTMSGGDVADYNVFARFSAETGQMTVLITGGGLTGYFINLARSQASPPNFTVEYDSARDRTLPGVVMPGNSMQLGPFRLRNDGGSNSGETVTVGFLISTDANIDPATDRYIGGYGLKALAPGELLTLPRVTMIVPPDMASGDYYVGAYVDWGRLVDESNEGDNAVSSPFHVGEVTGVGTASLDGLQPDSWNQAACWDFEVLRIVADPAIGTICIMNDATDLYAYVAYDPADLPGGFLNIRLDRDGDGVSSAGDDEGDFYFEFAALGTRTIDYHYFLSPTGSISGTPDDAAGGTNDVRGDESIIEGDRVMMWAKKLNSGDSRDMTLTPGQLVRLQVGVGVRTSGNLTTTSSPQIGNQWIQYRVH
ncbi:MAG TPA: CARDB domain-containing protein [Gemmatimonadaceae bacterium]|nr:CARDB domain-containing protein [Gemmatimonadaceae bacterium]